LLGTGVCGGRVAIAARTQNREIDRRTCLVSGLETLFRPHFFSCPTKAGLKVPPLPEIPVPPPSILDAADGGSLVLFVGAGVSRLAGSPGWDGFSNSVLNWLVAKGSINHSVRVQLST